MVTCSRSRLSSMPFPKHVVFPAIATVGIAACFLPVNKSPAVGSVLGIQVARGIAIGLSGACRRICCFGRWLRDPPWPKRRIRSIAAGIIMAVAVYRVVALRSHRMPTFDDDDPSAVPYYQTVCDQGDLRVHAPRNVLLDGRLRRQQGSAPSRRAIPKGLRRK